MRPPLFFSSSGSACGKSARAEAAQLLWRPVNRKRSSLRNERVLILAALRRRCSPCSDFLSSIPVLTATLMRILHSICITQYSHAQVRALDRLKENLNWIVPYASPEFLFPPGTFSAKFPAAAVENQNTDCSGDRRQARLERVRFHDERFRIHRRHVIGLPLLGRFYHTQLH